MTTQAKIGYGAQFLVATLATVAANPPTYVAIAEVTNITPPPMTRDVIDATNMDSPNGWREFIEGLKDGGECSISLNFLPGSAGDERLRGLQTEGATPIKIRFPGGVEWGFDAFCTGYTPTVPVDDKMTADATFKITGEPDFTDPS
jgi:predicted secreted protein